MSHAGILGIKDLNAALIGVFLILSAIFGILLAWPLSANTDVGIGPGYVPRMLGIVQIVLGGLIVRSSFVSYGEAPEAWHLRPPLFVLGAVTFFAFTIERLGLVISLAGLIALSCQANRETTFVETVSLVAGATLFSVVVFVKALGLSIELWPSQIWGL